ncbi:hypothetical protein [Bifidobacterium xylocopae]|uniref:Uncharacterized protein n=1 Tax=Bifidobacterium xylocopae TaxID=2493119 RepID=A0A366KD49_9BIFI|nr:hypothetical protein [Bifidobacterium xylocopae]RBP99098.1 hypothetical protein CRD59_05460 [Bifidobacterium xylocopae]
MVDKNDKTPSPHGDAKQDPHPGDGQDPQPRTEATKTRNRNPGSGRKHGGEQAEHRTPTTHSKASDTTQKDRTGTKEGGRRKEKASTAQSDHGKSQDGPSVAEQAGHLAGTAMRNVKEHSRYSPLYLGFAVAFAVASLGLAFSTFPIFLSLPVAGVLLGVSVWLLGHVGVIKLGGGEGEGNRAKQHRKSVRLTVISSLVGLQIAVTDIFLFTRLGSVGPRQSGIVVAWLIATALEALGAAVIVAADLHHRR